MHCYKLFKKLILNSLKYVINNSSFFFTDFVELFSFKSHTMPLVADELECCCVRSKTLVVEEDVLALGGEGLTYERFGR